ncbi:mismatch-specific DNA-glycosylase [Paenibacillus mesophilus]|uniref:mismatch-specific DNA-glycosylase n=1 Tax=Paenibacillus mesophilus TaxID=2582849 RepID=UPI00110E2DCD|nr:mismatch-specific DNA-glycosylase [Paenibacillus mesophilus]TMV52132.1 mismatch-specific DNA-glycosylase [Paenibacillus mesophilus]
MNPIPDHLDYGLAVLFIGYNPSVRSGETGHHYANPSNRFWKIIHEAGLTSRKYKPEEDGDLLKLGYGFTNIVSRPTKMAAEITKEEYKSGRLRLMDTIATYRPKVACFVGKGVYEQYSGRSGIDWGEQPDPVVPGVVEFVAPSSSGLVRMPTGEITEIFRRLTKYTTDQLRKSELG